MTLPNLAASIRSNSAVKKKVSNVPLLAMFLIDILIFRSLVYVKAANDERDGST